MIELNLTGDGYLCFAGGLAVLTVARGLTGAELLSRARELHERRRSVHWRVLLSSIPLFDDMLCVNIFIILLSGKIMLGILKPSNSPRYPETHFIL